MQERNMCQKTSTSCFFCINKGKPMNKASIIAAYFLLDIMKQRPVAFAGSTERHHGQQLGLVAHNTFLKRDKSHLSILYCKDNQTRVTPVPYLVNILVAQCCSNNNCLTDCCHPCCILYTETEKRRVIEQIFPQRPTVVKKQAHKSVIFFFFTRIKHHLFPLQAPNTPSTESSRQPTSMAYIIATGILGTI